MSQRDIIELLELEHVKNPGRWLSAPEIRDKLKSIGKCNGFEKNGYDDLYRLIASNLISWKGEGLLNHRKVFQAKK